MDMEKQSQNKIQFAGVGPGLASSSAPAVLLCIVSLCCVTVLWSLARDSLPLWWSLPLLFFLFAGRLGLVPVEQVLEEVGNERRVLLGVLRSHAPRAARLARARLRA